MKKPRAGVIEAGEPVIQQAMEAMRRYHEARDGQLSKLVRFFLRG